MDIRAAGKGYDEFVAAGHRRRRRRVHPRARQPHLPRRRHDQGLGLRHARRRAGRDRRRHGRAGHRHPPAARHRASWPRSSPSATTSTASSTRRTPSCARSRPTPPASSWPAPARRRATSPTRWPWPAPRPPRCSACSAPTSSSASRRSRVVNEQHLHRLLQLRARLPLRRHRAAATSATVEGHVCGHVAYVNPGVCQGCGTCEAVCLSKSVELAGLHRRAGLRRDQRPGVLGMSDPSDDDRRMSDRATTTRRLRAAHHRLRVQLVHLHRRRPGRHQPPAHGQQRAHHPPALHRPHRPAVHHQGLRARRRRRDRQRLPPGRLPLHLRQLPRPAALRRVPRAARASWASTRGASPSRGSRPPRAPSGATSSTRPSRACARLGPFDAYRELVAGAACRPSRTRRPALRRRGGRPPARRDRQRRRRRDATPAMNELRDTGPRSSSTTATVQVVHRLGGRPPRRPPGLRHRRRPTPTS